LSGLPDSDDGGRVKRCLDCGEVKPLLDFPPARRRLDGRNSYCRPCMNERSLVSYRKRQAAQGRTIRDSRIVPVGSRWCPDCDTFKSLSDFPRNRSGKAGHGSYCKPCHNKRGRENVIKNHGSTRNYHLMGRYGITAAEYERMLAEQGGVCAACRLVPPKHVDHDHKTGRVRGVLCSGCNQALGNIQDDVRRLRGLIDYLERGALRVRLVRCQEYDLTPYDVTYESSHGRAA
jgi:hypothetical protein